MPLNVEHLLRTANTLEQALLAIEAQENREDVKWPPFNVHFLLTVESERSH
jgi:hypothetical protein